MRQEKFSNVFGRARALRQDVPRLGRNTGCSAQTHATPHSVGEGKSLQAGRQADWQPHHRVGRFFFSWAKKTLQALQAAYGKLRKYYENFLSNFF